MSSLIMGTIGAVIGSFFGMPQLGWMIGASLGAAMDAPTIHNEGPRLDDLKVQTSTWGKMIAIVYGSMRVAGNVIWSTPIRETKHVEDTSAKGGPTMESTTYTYSVDMAVSLCQGPIFGVRKIWANGRLIYNVDVTVDAQTQLNNNGNTIQVYLGTETQLPDATIEADKGVGQVPAYRGQAYVVFTNFQLADYGNRVPNLEFEVLQTGTSLGFRLVSFLTNPFMIQILNWIMLSVEEGIIRVTRAQFTSTVYVFSLEGKFLGEEARRFDETSIANRFPNMIGFGPEYYFQIDYNALLPPPWGDPLYPVIVLLKNNIPYRPSVIPDNEYIAGAVLSADSKIIMITTSIVIAGAWTGMKWYQFYMDGRLYRSGPAQADATHKPFLNWRMYSSPFIGFIPRGRAAALESDYNHLWCHQYDDPKSFLYEINGTGLLERKNNFNSSSWSDAPAVYADDGIFVAVALIGVHVFSRNTVLASTKVPLSQIVLDQCQRSSLNTIDIDATALTDLVTGFSIPRQNTARNNIAQLQKAFYFDSAESEAKIKFKKRGSAPVVTIPYDDLAAHRNGEEPGDPLQITRTQEVDLPAAVTVKYLNEDGDYQIGSERSKRLITASKQQVVEELAIAMNANKGAQISEVLMYDAHVARTGFTFQTTRQYAYLEPTDVIVVQTPKASFRLRIVKKEDSDSLIKWNAVADDAAIYTSTAIGGSIQDPQLVIASPGPTRIEFLDIPILQDQDDNAGLYIAMSGYRDTWKGATLFRASDNLSFAPVGSVENAAVTGTSVDALGTWAGGNLPDEANTLTVNVITGTLATVTFDALLMGENAAMIGSEIIQFRTATLIAANQYRLSGLLRGRLGTEAAMATHVINERFVVLGIKGTLRLNEGPSAINVQRYYKAVSFNSALRRSGSYAMANTAVGLKPYAPVHVFGNRQANNDWAIRWTRRTRVDGTWRDNVDAALGEASESYEIDILQGVTIKRTLTSATPAVTYTSAQQVTDFGSNQTSITFKVYQLSATVGRGFPATRTL